jgi:hypothetical protein
MRVICVLQLFLANMRKHSFFFIFLLSFLSFWSCGRDSKKVAMMLQSAENAMEQFPDSALLFLDSIGNPYELNEKQHAECSDKNQNARLYLNLSKLYHHENKKDSALYYAGLALNLSENDNSLKVSIYSLLSKIEASAGNYQKSLEYHQLFAEYLDSIFDEKENVNILEIQKKYDFELLQNANKKLTIERLWILIISISVIFILSFVFYRNIVQNREALSTARQQFYLLKEMVNDEDKKNGSASDPAHAEINKQLRAILFKQLDIFKKISLLENYLKNEEKEKGEKILEKVNETMYDSKGTFDWKFFYHPINALYNNYLIRLVDLYPELDEEEILVCCLSKTGFSNTEIALLTGSTPNVVQKKNPANCLPVIAIYF